MRSVRRVMMTVLLAMACGSCSAVVSDHLIGREADAATTMTLVGTWHAGDSTLRLGMTGPGHLEAVISNGDAATEPTRVAATLTTQGSALYLQARLQDFHPAATEPAEGPPGRAAQAYLFYRAVVVNAGGSDEPGFLLLFPPQIDTFMRAVDHKKLKGAIGQGQGFLKGTTVWVQGKKADWDKFVLPEKAGEQFDLNAALVFTRDARPAEAATQPDGRR